MEGNDAINQDNRTGVKEHVEFLVDQPVEFAPVHTDPATKLLPLVLAEVGATLPKRDPVDLRIIDETTTGKTHHDNCVVHNPDEVGGWPELKSTEPAPDSDHDRTPDWWETKYRLNPNDPADGGKDLNGDGYTNVEKFLNGIDPTKKIDWSDRKNNKNALTPTALAPH